MAEDAAERPDSTQAGALRDARLRESAVREILDVISQSRDDERPVFDVVLRKSAHLCGASLASLNLVSEDRRNVVKMASWGDQASDQLPAGSTLWPMDADNAPSVCVREGRIVHVHDMADTDLYRSGDERRVAAVNALGIRTFLAVPLFSGDHTIGCISVYRQEIRPFAADEIALVETFAAQAVIAIENVRQFREVQTRLEREQASREILDVISRSRDDVAPVLAVIVHNAARLCDSPDVGLHLVNDADTHSRLECVSDADRGIFQIGHEFDLAAPHQTPTCIREGRTIHIHDIADDDLYRNRDPIRVRLVEEDGVRTRLSVPLMKDGVAFGCINLNRHEVRPFRDDEIALIDSFAAQAVIAIENARQFREVKERLAREQATAEILGVISQSRDDEGPVFDAILRNAQTLCNAPMSALILATARDEYQTLAAYRGVPPSTVKMFETRQMPVDRDKSYAARSIVDCSLIAFRDMGESDLYTAGSPVVRSMVDVSGIRSVLFVPLLRSGQAIGTITLFREAVDPFDTTEIALVETFAAQAVIAIENVRQFRELQTRLERERASAEILEVISQSRDDEAPVFAAILENAARLCNAPMADLDLVDADGRCLREVAAWGPIDREIGSENWVWPMDSDYSHVAAVRTGEIAHVADIKDSDRYRAGDPVSTAVVDIEGIRTFLAVPLLANGRGIGCLVLFRQEVRPFSADEIALVETFAAQAVIAIENVRQFRELQTRLERETASREILGVISRSRNDDLPVFGTILENAARLCVAQSAALYLVNDDSDRVMMMADWGQWRHQIRDSLGTTFMLDPARPDTESILAGRVVHIDDMADTRAYLEGDPLYTHLVDEEGLRTRLSVPLLREGTAFGYIVLSRRESHPFSADQIALVETFAAQAVIAIENVRQFREVQERLQREQATKEILHVISQSRDDEMPVFRAILSRAERLCNAQASGLQLVNDAGTHLRYVVGSGADRGGFQAGEEFDLAGPLAMATAAREGRVVHSEDLMNSDLYRSGNAQRVKLVDQEGVRTQLAVPLLRNGVAMGTMTLSRLEQKPFSADEIALVETFAAQAVIAIENVRQFRELQTRLERETASREILGVISRSRDDEQPVFDAILDNAARLCAAPNAGLMLVDEDGLHFRQAAEWGKWVGDLDGLDGWPIDAQLPVAEVIRTRRTLHLEDMTQIPAYLERDPTYVRVVEVEGLRTRLILPLVHGDTSVGAITLSRHEARPFSDDEITLVETFAAQAVIAIENVRQFREVQERLERERASAEVLEVISRSRDDEFPVFETVLRNASRLCRAETSALLLGRRAEGKFRLAAYHSADQVLTGEAFAAQADTRSVMMDLDPGQHLSAETILKGEVIHVEDLTLHPGYLAGIKGIRDMVEFGQERTFLSVPLIDRNGPIGALNMQRQRVQAFRPDEIALVQSFAAQAVIAIENVRQFREVQERLEREQAVKNILRVISESPDDEQPTFEAILDSATRLCGTPYASLVLGRAGDAAQVMVATRHSTPETLQIYRDGTVPMDPEDSLAAKAILEGRTILVPDMAETRQYKEGHPRFRTLVDNQGIRTNMFVPLVTPAGGIGCFILWKKEPAPFTQDQIALVETFAAHAVIAIENVRQFKALETLNAELGDRVTEQVGEIERMGRLKRFLSPAVANAVVSTGNEKLLSSHRALIAVLFADIRGFTAFCESAEPEETIEVLQTYHEEMGRLIADHGAGVDTRSGDGIMVIFNDPLPCDDPAGDCTRLAFAMRTRMVELCAGWKRLGHRLGFGVGVSLGYATVGMVGAAGRYEYTASGTAVNLASRLCDQAEDGEILLSPRAYAAVDDRITAEVVGEMQFKGMRAPIEVVRALRWTENGA